MRHLTGEEATVHLKLVHESLLVAFREHHAEPTHHILRIVNVKQRALLLAPFRAVPATRYRAFQLAQR